jgi:hypothetical protein
MGIDVGFNVGIDIHIKAVSLYGQLRGRLRGAVTEVRNRIKGFQAGTATNVAVGSLELLGADDENG